MTDEQHLSLAEHVLGLESILKKVLLDCSPQDEFSLACASTACRQASIQLREIDIRGIAGLKGNLEREIIEAYEEAKKAEGKRPTSVPKNKLHPAIRKMAMDCGRDEIVVRVRDNLISVLREYHGKGRILMSAHSHFVALCYAADNLGLGTALKLRSRTFTDSLYASVKSTKYGGALSGDFYCTVILGRFLTHPAGLERGWNDLGKIKKSLCSNEHLFPHGNYYECIMGKPDDYTIITFGARFDTLTDKLFFANYHFKPSGKFARLVFPKIGGYRNSMGSFHAMVSNINRSKDVVAADVAIIFTKLSLNCSLLLLSDTFKRIRKSRPDLIFSTEQLERIADVEQIDAQLKVSPGYMDERFIEQSAHLIAVFKGIDDAYLTAKLRTIPFERAICRNRIKVLLERKEFHRLMAYLDKRCPDLSTLVDSAMLKHASTDRSTCLLGQEFLMEKLNRLPLFKKGIESSLYYIMTAQGPNDDVRFQDIAVTVVDELLGYDSNAYSYHDAYLKAIAKVRTGSEWKSIGITCISPFFIEPFSAQLLVKRLVRIIVKNLKRTRVIEIDDDAEDHARYEKAPRLEV